MDVEPDYILTTDAPDYFGETVKRIAARLGVEPRMASASDPRDGIILHCRTGEDYSLAEIMEAFLARIESATPEGK